MGAIAGSRFFGYRELARPPRRQGGLPPPFKLGFSGMPIWEVDMLQTIPYTYKVFRGVADDSFPAEFSMFPATVRVLLCLIKDHGAIIVGTDDGVTALQEREYDQGFVRLENLEGFKIKNAVAGLKARFQLVAFSSGVTE